MLKQKWIYKLTKKYIHIHHFIHTLKLATRKSENKQLEMISAIHVTNLEASLLQLWLNKMKKCIIQ